MRPSRRLDQIPPYLFAQLERKIAEKRAAGVDVISLGIGDPDTPTYAPIVAAAQRAVADPSTHTYHRTVGEPEFREAVADFYDRRFGVALDPETEVMRRSAPRSASSTSAWRSWTPATWRSPPTPATRCTPVAR